MNELKNANDDGFIRKVSVKRLRHRRESELYLQASFSDLPGNLNCRTTDSWFSVVLGRSFTFTARSSSPAMILSACCSNTCSI